MSRDQLSWDKILNTDNQSPNSSADSPAENSAQPEQAEKSLANDLSRTPNATPKKKAKTTRRKKKAVTTVEESTSYSQKNWSKLEFGTRGETSLDQASLEKKPTEEIIITETQKTSIEVTKTNSVAVEKAVEPGTEASEANANEEEAEPQVLSVSELNRYIREILEGQFPILWLKAEISNFKAHTSGHFYFSLKDSKAQINAVMFRGFNSQLRFRPEDGMEVLVRGKVTVYEPRGNYQIFCEVMEPVGAGALQKAYEQLKAKLQKEGLFDQARKRPLPALPKHIAIVTSPTGAAIRDMLNVLGRRFKGVRITVIPCKVQGDQAPAEICSAIALANQLSDVDVMIVGRGGGSIEDLWAFNDENVARAIASARVPVISAVGHEVDFTIADFVADLRAPTPSAAAELVVRNAADLAERVMSQTRALRLALLRSLNQARQELISFSKRLVDPQRRIQDAAMRCDELMQRLEGSILRNFQARKRQLQIEARLKTAVRNSLMRKREMLSKNAAVLDSLSPLKVLDRGYSMVTVDGEIITDAKSLKVGQDVTVRMCKGSIEAKVTKVGEKR